MASRSAIKPSNRELLFSLVSTLLAGGEEFKVFISTSGFLHMTAGLLRVAEVKEADDRWVELVGEVLGGGGGGANNIRLLILAANSLLL